MPKLPSWKFHKVSYGGSCESVSTNSPNKNRKETDTLVKETKRRLDSVFSEGFTAENYAASLLRRCVSVEPEGRTREVDSTIDHLVKLERLCFSVSQSERAEFFRQTKRFYVSKILESVLPKLKNADYRASTLETWSKWIYSKWFSDVGDFWFWNGWRDRFFAEEHAPYEDLPLNF